MKLNQPNFTVNNHRKSVFASTGASWHVMLIAIQSRSDNKKMSSLFHGSNFKSITQPSICNRYEETLAALHRRPSFDQSFLRQPLLRLFKIVYPNNIILTTIHRCIMLLVFIFLSAFAVASHHQKFRLQLERPIHWFPYRSSQEFPHRQVVPFRYPDQANLFGNTFAQHPTQQQLPPVHIVK